MKIVNGKLSSVNPSSSKRGVWPAHGVETLPWRQQSRGGTREDRMMTSVDAAIPPAIAALDYTPELNTIRLAEAAILALGQADTDAAGHSAALSRFLIRTESVASSKIERVNASAADYAKAVAGSRANTSATSMVAATTALHNLIEAVDSQSTFTANQLLSAHRSLMADDPQEASYAGRYRDMQNWIGGSDHSPRGALYTPPAAARVDELVADLINYLNRDDVPVLVQAAIAHAQFESIHAFTDGNGRIGRALVAALLRRRGATPHSVIPIASGLLARRDEYFAALGSYRRGDPAPIVDIFARSTHAAATCSRHTIARLNAIPGEWLADLTPQHGSAVARLVPAFYDHPIMNQSEAEELSGASAVQTYRAIKQLEEAGFVEEVTGRKRDRVWVASDLIAELDDLDRRIGEAMVD